MTIAFPKPYISGLIVNFNNHVIQAQAVNNQGVPIKTGYGKQIEAAEVSLDLYLTPTRNVGTQKYQFTTKTTLGNDVYSELPPLSSILSPETREAWINAFGNAIDDKIPEFDGSDDLGASEVGAKTYLRINRLEAQLPYDKPAERFIAIFVGVYLDKDFKVQVLDADFSVLFVSDEFITRRAGQQLDAEQLLQKRAELQLYSLSDLLTDTDVQTGIVSLATSFFTVLKEKAYAFEGIDVAKVMVEFGTSFTEIVS